MEIQLREQRPAAFLKKRKEAGKTKLSRKETALIQKSSAVSFRPRLNRRYASYVCPVGTLGGHPRFLGARKLVAPSAPQPDAQLSCQWLHHGVALIAGVVQNQRIIRCWFGFRCKLN